MKRGVFFTVPKIELQKLEKAAAEYDKNIDCSDVLAKFVYRVGNDLPEQTPVNCVFIAAPDDCVLLHFAAWLDYCLQYPKWGKQPLGYLLRCIQHPDFK